MDSGGGGPNNSRYQRKLPSSDRLLGIFSTAHSQSQPSISSSASTSAAEVELSEHDIFDTSSDAVQHSTPSTSTSPNANYHRSTNHLSHHKHFGILAALPESESHAQALLSVSSSSSSSSTSSARLIPSIPKRPPVDRVKYLQSAPVNVPVMSAAARRRGRHFDDDDDDLDGGEMLPPHEIVASRKTPILASSVVEGAGRKLKGRDLRQVRDAILQKTACSLVDGGKLGFALFITLVLATLQFSSCYVLKGSVTCLDCSQHIDLSGIKVSVKCSQVKTLTMATTEDDGFFETKLPFTPTNKCYAKILGGPNQLFISRKQTDPNIVKSQEDDNSYTISTPLKFYTKCPSSNKNANGKCNDEFGSSKTIDLPVPKEWGIAPTSYYVPFLPIIGIP